MVDFGEFVAHVERVLRMELAAPVNPYDSLYDDFGLDLFKALKVMRVCERLAGDAVRPKSPPELYTLADAYAYYRSLWEQAARDGSG